MGQNNDNTERGDLQGNQGGNLSKDPKEHQRLRQPEEGFARVGDEPMPVISRNPQRATLQQVAELKSAG